MRRKQMTSADQPGSVGNELVTVTREMEHAGLACVHECTLADLGYLVRSIYMAMEYERRNSLAKLGAVGDQPSQIGQS
jgi:hypothetical protein